MSRPNKVRYTGVGVMFNGYTGSRIQTLSIDTDLGEEEARELTNEEVVEYTATNPQVTVQIETNEYGSCRNIRAIASVTGNVSITAASFDGTSTDIAVVVEEDGTLTRTVLVNDAYLTSLGWSYDVGGVATETFSFDADNKTWYANAQKQVYSLIGITGSITAGEIKIFIPVTTGTYLSGYTPLALYVNGIAVSGLHPAATTGSYGGTDGLFISGFDQNWASTTAEYAYAANGTKPSTMPRFRGVIYKTAPDTTVTLSTSKSATPIGSIPRGKLDIYLATGGEIGYGSNNTTNFLRLQSLSIDAELSREVINELGHYRAVERSLSYPIPVNLSFSTLANDLTEWAKFSSKVLADETSLSLTNFTKTCSIQVRIFDKNDTDTTRQLLKSITVTGLQIVGESFGVDVGGNATQDYTGKASNFTVVGSGIPGIYPATYGASFTD